MKEYRVTEIAVGSGLYERSRELRNRVLLRPIGLADGSRESDDAAATHFAAVSSDADAVIGVVLLVPIESPEMPTAQLRQMAVDDAWQGRGVGAALVHALCAHAADRGIERIVCHARQPAVRFYERLGFEVLGEAFEEVGVTHRFMQRSL